MTQTQTPVPRAAEPVRHPRRNWPYFLAIALILTLLGGAGYVLYRTPLLGVEEVEVTAGTTALPPQVQDAVTAAVGEPTGTPLISIDLAAVRRRVLGVPQIATAAVSRHWPHLLLIAVTPRVPVATTSANGALWLLDAAGFPYLKVTADQVPAGLLTVDLATPGRGDPSTLAALQVIGGLKAPIRPMVVRVSAPSVYAVKLTLADGRIVVWGSADQAAKKMQILPAVLAQTGHTYDISDPDFVTISAN